MKTLARNYNVHPEDVFNVKSALSVFGYYDHEKDGISEYPNDQMFHSIKAFQKDNNLKVDGIMKPFGETISKIKQKFTEIPQIAGASTDFAKNYFDMREAWTKGGDKYFHCKANYEATKRGEAGENTAKQLSNTRAWFKKEYRHNSNLDIFEDQGVNIYGREAAKSGKYESSRQGCKDLRPRGLDDRY